MAWCWSRRWTAFACGSEDQAVGRLIVRSLRPAIRPAIDMSSSRESQCMPPALSSYESRCAVVAIKSLGNHASGMSSTRPSSSDTHMVSLSNRTSAAEIITPSLCNQNAVSEDNAKDSRLVLAVEVFALGHADRRFEPDFRLGTGFANMCGSVRADLPRSNRRRRCSRRGEA